MTKRVRHWNYPPPPFVLESMTKKRQRTAVSILIVLAVGLLSRSYRGVASMWVSDSLGGLFYVLFWVLVVFFLWQNARPGRIAAVVLLVTCALEFLQIWHPHFLEVMRRPPVGRAMLGHFFAWSDIPYYFVGAGIGWLWVTWLNSMESAGSQAGKSL